MIIIISIILIIVLIFFPIVMDQIMFGEWKLYSTNLSKDQWIGFLGSFVGSIVGSLATIWILYITITHEKNMKKEEMEQKFKEEYERKKEKEKNKPKIKMELEIGETIDSVGAERDRHFKIGSIVDCKGYIGVKIKSNYNCNLWFEFYEDENCHKKIDIKKKEFNFPIKVGKTEETYAINYSIHNPKVFYIKISTVRDFNGEELYSDQKWKVELDINHLKNLPKIEEIFSEI